MPDLESLDSAPAGDALSLTRQAAMRLLARREFGAAELADRLCQKGYPKETVEIVVKWLKEKDLQNDERFVEVFVRSKKSRGQGPVRLRAELQQLAISEEVINRYLIEDDEEWIALARQVFQKRFGSFKKTRWEERAKQQRFLYYRGFSFEQINAALAQIDQ